MSLVLHGTTAIDRESNEEDMNIEPDPSTSKGPTDRFTGDVYVEMIAAPKADGQSMVASRVRFAPGARTAWHSHVNGQTLHVTQGIALMQSRGGEILVVRAGQTVYTPPGEEHWHGATPEQFMEHLALLDGAHGSDATTWLEQVSGDEYHLPA